MIFNRYRGIPINSCKYSLVEILKSNPGPQMSYQVGFCFWLLTFDQDIAEQINKYASINFYYYAKWNIDSCDVGGSISSPYLRMLPKQRLKRKS